VRGLAPVLLYSYGYQPLWRVPRASFLFSFSWHKSKASLPPVAFDTMSSDTTCTNRIVKYFGVFCIIKYEYVESSKVPKEQNSGTQTQHAIQIQHVDFFRFYYAVNQTSSVPHPRPKTELTKGHCTSRQQGKTTNTD
jgi:hypothetical protein